MFYVTVTVSRTGGSFHLVKHTTIWVSKTFYYNKKISFENNNVLSWWVSVGNHIITVSLSVLKSHHMIYPQQQVSSDHNTVHVLVVSLTSIPCIDFLYSHMILTISKILLNGLNCVIHHNTSIHPKHYLHVL